MPQMPLRAWDLGLGTWDILPLDYISTRNYTEWGPRMPSLDTTTITVTALDDRNPHLLLTSAKFDMYAVFTISICTLRLPS